MASNGIFDSSIYGTTTDSGKITILRNSEALSNAIIAWLLSYRKDRLRNPSHGGYLTSAIGKEMTEERAELIKYSLSTGFNQDFTPYFVLTNLEVIPVPDKEKWRIQIEGYSPTVKAQAGVDIFVKNNI